MADLEPSRSHILDAWSVILIFSLIATFYITKTENRTKKSLAQLSSLSEDTIFAKNADFLQNNADISKMIGV